MANQEPSNNDPRRPASPDGAADGSFRKRLQWPLAIVAAIGISFTAWSLWSKRESLAILLGVSGPDLGDDRGVAESHGWIYDDFEKGLEEARATGKPLMVVVRCHM